MFDALCTWIYLEDGGFQSDYPQMRGDSAALHFQAVYWRCVAVLFATASRICPDANLILFTNAEILPTVDGVNLERLFSQLRINVIRVPFTFCPPKGYWRSWGNQFYLFDILRAAQDLSGLGRMILLDSDCVIVRPLDAMFAAISDHGALTYHINYPPEKVVNGLNAFETAKIYHEIDGEGPQLLPKYFGGEVVAVNYASLRKIVEHSQRGWHASLERFGKGLSKFNEEAQLLSYAYSHLGFEEGTANVFIRRIWTGRSLRNSSVRDFALAIWHLPAEKRTGLDEIFRDVTIAGSPFWCLPLDTWVPYLATVLGVPKASFIKRAKDFARLSAYRLRSLV